MMERASKVPHNDSELADIVQIMKQQDRTNEFENDMLRVIKEKALASLHSAIVQQRKLNLSLILAEAHLSDVLLVARLMQLMELALTMHPELA